MLDRGSGAGETRETPQEALREFAAAIERGDVRLAASLVSRDACLVTPDATAVSGREAIEGVLAQLAGMRLRIHFGSGRWLLAGDVALLCGSWQSATGRGDGSSLQQDWSSTMVLRRHELGWRLQIIAPWERQGTAERERPVKRAPARR